NSIQLTRIRSLEIRSPFVDSGDLSRQTLASWGKKVPMPLPNQPSPEIKQYAGVKQCDEAIEFFEDQVKGYSDKLRKLGHDIAVPDEMIAELEQDIAECEQLALAFEEEACGRERQIVYLLDALIAVASEAGNMTRARAS